MSAFLFDIVNELSRITIKDAISNGKRMLSAIVIICCLHEMIVNNWITINCYQRSQLFYLLHMRPDITHKTCEDWNILKGFIPESFRREAGRALYSFIKHQIQGLNKHFSLPSWLYAIPTAHFLSLASKPFQDLQLDPRRIEWEDSFIDLATVKKKTYQEYATQ